MAAVKGERLLMLGFDGWEALDPRQAVEGDGREGAPCCRQAWERDACTWGGGSVCNSGGRQWGRSSLLKIQGAMEQEEEEAATKGREGGAVHRE